MAIKKWFVGAAAATLALALSACSAGSLGSNTSSAGALG